MLILLLIGYNRLLTSLCVLSLLCLFLPIKLPGNWQRLGGIALGVPYNTMYQHWLIIRSPTCQISDISRVLIQISNISQLVFIQISNSQLFSTVDQPADHIPTSFLTRWHSTHSNKGYQVPSFPAGTATPSPVRAHPIQLQSSREVDWHRSAHSAAQRHRQHAHHHAVRTPPPENPVERLLPFASLYSL